MKKPHNPGATAAVAIAAAAAFTPLKLRFELNSKRSMGNRPQNQLFQVELSRLVRKDFPMRINLKSASIFVSLVLAVPTFSATSASAALPSKFEAELKAATKVEIGKAIPMALPDCKIVRQKKKFVSKCTYEKFVVTINSFKFDRRTTPIDVEVSVYAIDVKLENYSKKTDAGLDVGAFLRCKNEKTYSPFYSDSIDPQDVPAGTELSGVIFSSLPDDFSVEQCQMPTLWISLFNAGVDMKDKAVVAEAKKKKLVSRAYIPLTPEMLAAS